MDTTAPTFNSSGRTTVTERRAIYAESLAMSREFNLRNVEFPWYTSWNQYLMDLIGDHNPRLLLSPQYLLWVDPNNPAEPEGDGDTQGGSVIDESIYPESIANASLGNPRISDSESNRVQDWLDQVASEKELSSPSRGHIMPLGDDVLRFLLSKDEETEDSSVIDPFDISEITISTTTTAPDGKSGARIADFAVIYVTPKATSKFPLRYRGFRISGVRVELLVENKRYVKRTLSGPPHDHLVIFKIREGRQDVIVQAAVLFRASAVTSVTAIATAGPYWSSSVLELVENNIPDKVFNEALKKGRLQFIRSTVKVRTEWSKIVRMGTPASDVLLQPIHDKLAQLPGQLCDVETESE